MQHRKQLAKLYRWYHFTRTYELKKEEYPRINLPAGSVAHPHYSSDFLQSRRRMSLSSTIAPSYPDKSVLQSWVISTIIWWKISHTTRRCRKKSGRYPEQQSRHNGMIQAGRTYRRPRNHRQPYLQCARSQDRTRDQVRRSPTARYHHGGQFVLVFVFSSVCHLWSFRLKILHNSEECFPRTYVFVSCILTELCDVRVVQCLYPSVRYRVEFVVRTFFDFRAMARIHDLIIVLIRSLMVPFPHEFLLLSR